MTQTNLTQCLNYLLILKNNIKADCTTCAYKGTLDCDPNLCNHINETLDYFTKLTDEHVTLETNLNTFFFNIEGLLKTSSEEHKPIYTSILKLAEELNLRKE